MAVAEARATLTGMLPPGVAVGAVPRRRCRRPRRCRGRADRESDVGACRVARASAARRRATFEADAARRARRPSPTVFGGLKRADDCSGRDTACARRHSIVAAVRLGQPRSRALGCRTCARRSRAHVDRIAHSRRDQRRARRLDVRLAALAQEPPTPATSSCRSPRSPTAKAMSAFSNCWMPCAYRARAHMRAIDLRFDARLAQLALERAVGELLWP